MGTDRERRDRQGGSKAATGGRGSTFSTTKATGGACPTCDEIASIGRVLDAVIASGDAIILSRTSDGGAVVITLLSDSGREKAYASTEAELSRAFEDLRAKYGGG